MSSHRKPRLSAARKRVRAVTLCAATLGAAALPSLAQAATTSGGTGAVQAAVPATTVHTAARAHYADAASSGTAKTEAVSASSSSSSSAKSSYTVVSGDTLFGIAQRTLGSGDDYPKLFKLNKGQTESDGRTFTDANLIYPGWKIQLPSGASDASGASDSASGAKASTASGASSSSKDSGSSATASSASSSSSSNSGSSSSSGYANDLNGWINQAISILAQHGYTVSYNAIYQAAMNESSGNPNAVNNWDSNAAAGTPSIGLLQVIQPTFDAYALPGYDDIYNPVDNIIAAAIYAQDTYGGLDNVVAARCGGSCWYGY